MHVPGEVGPVPTFLELFAAKIMNRSYKSWGNNVVRVRVTLHKANCCCERIAFLKELIIVLLGLCSFRSLHLTFNCSVFIRLFKKKNFIISSALSVCCDHLSILNAELFCCFPPIIGAPLRPWLLLSWLKHASHVTQQECTPARAGLRLHDENRPISQLLLNVIHIDVPFSYLPRWCKRLTLVSKHDMDFLSVETILTSQTKGLKLVALLSAFRVFLFSWCRDTSVTWSNLLCFSSSRCRESDTLNPWPRRRWGRRAEMSRLVEKMRAGQVAVFVFHTRSENIPCQDRLPVWMDKIQKGIRAFFFLTCVLFFQWILRQQISEYLTCHWTIDLHGHKYILKWRCQ